MMSVLKRFLQGFDPDRYPDALDRNNKVFLSPHSIVVSIHPKVNEERLLRPGEVCIRPCLEVVRNPQSQSPHLEKWLVGFASVP